MTGRMHAMRAAEGAAAGLPTLREAGLKDMAARLSAALLEAVHTLQDWRARAHERAVLATLDERALRDIGVTRAEVMVEIDKGFWRR